MKTNTVILTLFMCSFVFGCYTFDKKGQDDSRYLYDDCNVILVSIDTLRSDHLGCYGYEKSTSPSIDRFAKESVLFKTVIAQASSTESSHASIFTSLIPSHHGASYSRHTSLGENMVTMAEILKDNGYTTISFNNGCQVSADFGLNQGFDEYHEVQNYYFKEIVQLSTDWISNNMGRKFFLFLHTYETHHPYIPKKIYMKMFARKQEGKIPRTSLPYTLKKMKEKIKNGKLDKQLLESSFINLKEVVLVSFDIINAINKGNLSINEDDLDFIIGAYDADIRSMDEGMLSLIPYLKKQGLYDNTIIIFTSDHGEEFGEHGFIGWHSHSLYDELLKVPLIIRFPKSRFASRVIDAQVRSIDILPTLLDILGIPPRKRFDGESLMGLMTRKTKKLFAISERDTTENVNKTSMRTDKWKLYDSSLYNLETDPYELNDAAKRFPYILNLMKKINNNLIKSKVRDEPVPNKGITKLKNETLESLKSLGYIQ